MKTLFKVLFCSKSYKRLCLIRKKQQARLLRLQEVVKELNEWSDIPISQMFHGLCKTLKIKPDKAALCFMHELLLSNMNLEEQAKKLPLE